MYLVKLCIENVEIRGYFVDRVHGIYVRGMVKSPTSIYKCRKEVWEERNKEVLEDWMKADTSELYPDIQGDIGLKLVHYKPGKEQWFSLCPFASKKDMPFEHGCQLWQKEFALYKDEKNIQYSFILIGKDNCKRLEDCAISLARKLGMDPEVHELTENSKSNTLSLFYLAIEDIRNLFPSR